MYLRCLVIFAMSFTGTHLMKHELFTILELKKNLFYKVNEEIHNSINKIFSIVKLHKNFTECNETSILLALHTELTKISEENYREYMKMRNVTRISDDKKINLNVYELVCEIINGHRYYSAYDKYRRKHKDKINSSELEDHLDVIKVFVDKLNTFTAERPPWENLDDIQTRRTPKPRSLNKEVRRASKNITEESSDVPMTRRLFKGRRTTFRKHPFIVSIHIMGEFFCAGSIITKDLVITAASCLQIAYTSKIFNSNTHPVSVRVGSDFTTRFGDIIPISETFFHPKFQPVTLRNNLAIIKLSRSLNFEQRNARVQRIQYDQRHIGFNGMEDVMVLGWGAVKESQTDVSANRLSFVRLSIYDFNKCKDIYTRFYVTDSNFCAGFERKGNGACNRDVGGPAIVDEVLVGVISFGPSTCGAQDAPTVFTRLSQYREWIESIVQKAQWNGSLVNKNKVLKSDSNKLYKNVGRSGKRTKAIVDDETPPNGKPLKNSLSLNDVFQELLVNSGDTSDDLSKSNIKPEDTEDSNESTEEGLSIETIIRTTNEDKSVITANSFFYTGIRYTLVDPISPTRAPPSTAIWDPLVTYSRNPRTKYTLGPYTPYRSPEKHKARFEKESRSEVDPIVGLTVNTSSLNNNTATNLNINFDLLGPVLKFFKEKLLRDSSMRTGNGNVTNKGTADFGDDSEESEPGNHRGDTLFNEATQFIPHDANNNIADFKDTDDISYTDASEPE